MKKRVLALGHELAFIDRGTGPMVVFLHGNPTSSFLWRNVLPHVANAYRCIAPDLLGMGDSDKLAESGPDSYGFAEHAAHLDAFMDAVAVDEQVRLVLHDWGSALGFDWARRHASRIAGIAYMEAIVCPLSWDTWPARAADVFRAFRSPAGEALVLEQNTFVERVLPLGVLRELSAEELDAYRAPFREPGESRRPTLSFPRQLPFEGEGPADVHAAVEAYGHWLATSTGVPKLFVDVQPGAILGDRERERCRAWPNQREVVVRGSHYVQEDSPEDIGRALAAWLPATHAA